jgi:hypothetical protein
MTELEKLKNAVELIESATGGRHRLVTGSIGQPCFRPADDAYVHIEAILRPDWHSGKYAITFGAAMRRSGGHLDATGLSAAANEIGAVAELLTVLDKESISVTSEELRQWSEGLRSQNEHQETAQESGFTMEPSL